MAAHFDISVESLREWKRLYFDSKSGKFVGKKLDPKDQEIKVLRKQVTELTQEREILKKAHFLKDRKMKLSLLKKLSLEFPIEKMAKIFDIPRSSYYSWLNRKQSKRALENLSLTNLLTKIFFKKRKSYGSRRLLLGT